jgi:hypothetical protein
MPEDDKRVTMLEELAASCSACLLQRRYTMWLIINEEHAYFKLLSKRARRKLLMKGTKQWMKTKKTES